MFLQSSTSIWPSLLMFWWLKRMCSKLSGLLSRKYWKTWRTTHIILIFPPHFWIRILACELQNGSTKLHNSETIICLTHIHFNFKLNKNIYLWAKMLCALPTYIHCHCLYTFIFQPYHTYVILIVIFIYLYNIDLLVKKTKEIFY